MDGTSHHRLGGFNEHKFIIFQFCSLGLDIFQVFYTHCQSILQKVFTPDTERTSISAKLKVHILQYLVNFKILGSAAIIKHLFI